MYEFKSRIRYSEVDCFGKLNIVGILNYFQDCSTFHTEESGIGVEKLHEEDFVWVLSNWNVVITRYPRMGESITIGTFPYEYKGFFGRRNYIMKDEAGQTLAMADTLWAFLNYKEGTLARIPKAIGMSQEMEPRLPIERVRGKIIIPEKLEEIEPVIITNRYIDVNQHVNNVQHVSIMLDCVENKDYGKVRVEYRKQVKPGEIVIPYVGNNESGKLVVLKDKEGQVCSVMELDND